MKGAFEFVKAVLLFTAYIIMLGVFLGGTVGLLWGSAKGIFDLVVSIISQ